MTDMHTHPSGKLQLAHEETGDGLPVVLLHPFPLDHSYWAPQLTAFVDHCRMIAPDMRGFGGTPAIAPYNVDRYADDVVALLDQLSIDRAVIGGCSIGGYITLALWRRHRDRVRGLMLFDTRARADNADERLKRAGQVDFAREHGAGAVADVMVPMVLGATTLERHPEIADRARQIMGRATVDGIIGAVEAMMHRPDSTALLPTIDVPTLIVCGAEDTAAPPDESRLMHDRIPGSVLEIIEGAGHLSSLERPAAVNHVIREFLAGLIYQ